MLTTNPQSEALMGTQAKIDDKILQRPSDLFVSWDEPGHAWLTSHSGGGRLRLAELPLVLLLDSFDGRRSAREIAEAVTASPGAIDEILRSIDWLHQLGFLVEKDHLGSYFQSYTLESHHAMLRDQPRNEAYRKAILELVRPGDVVVDLGTGTGILALFACQAGAHTVYALEPTRWSDVASKVIAENGFADRVQVIQAKSSSVELPEKADVLVSECMQTFFFDERMFLDVLEARDRFLVDGGRIIPSQATLLMAPVELSALYDDWVTRWTSRMQADYGLDFRPLEEIALANTLTRSIPHDALLARPRPLHRVDLATAAPQPTEFTSELAFTIERDGYLHGFEGHFEARLGPRVTLSTAPNRPQTHWQQSYFPLRALQVRARDVLQLAIEAAESSRNRVRLELKLRYELQRGDETIACGDAFYPAV